VLRAAHWYVLPTIEWFIRNWDAIFHEERLPLQNAGADAASAMTRLLIQPLGLVRRDLDEFERLRQWQTWWSRHNLADSSSGGIYPDLYLRRWGDLLEISTSSYTAEGTPSHFAYRNVDIVARPHVSDVSLAIHDVLTRAIGELRHRRPDSARIRELAEACAALENDGSRYERRLMFLSGVDPTDDQAVAAFRSLWSGVNEALRGLMSEGPLLTSDDSIRAAVGAASSGLVLETAPQLALLFGSYSPTITVDDVQVMIRSLHAAYSQARRIELPELPPLAYRGLTAGQEGSYMGEEAYRLLVPEEAQYVDIAAILGTLGIAYDTQTLSDPNTRAVTVLSQSGRAHIVVNDRYLRGISERVFRFSLAHELAHLFLDRDRSAQLAVVSGPWAPRVIEQRANAFAAALLMPEPLLRRHALALEGQLWRPRVAQQLAALLRVSLSSLADRVYNLLLVTREEADNIIYGSQR